MMASQQLHLFLAAFLCTTAFVVGEWSNGHSPAGQDFPDQVWNHIGPDDIGLIAPAGAPWGRKLIISGGYDGYENRTDVWAFNLFKDVETENGTASWLLTPERLESLFHGRSHHTSNVFKNFLITLGSAANCSVLAEEPIEAQHLYSSEHEHVDGYGINDESALFTPRAGQSAVVYGNQLYIFGGFNKYTNKYTGELWVANIETAATNGDGNITLTRLYSDATSPVGGRAGHTAILYQDSMYIYGGMNEKGYLGDVWRFDFLSGVFVRHYRWEDKRSYPKPRVGHSAVYWTDEGFYVWGGYNSRNGYLNDMWRFDLQKEQWEMVFEGTQAGYATEINEPGVNVPSGRSHFVYSVVDSKLVIIGGQVGAAGVDVKFWSPNTRFVPIFHPEDFAGDVWAFDFCSKEWTFIGCLPPWEDVTDINNPEQCRSSHKPRCPNDCSGNGVCVRDQHCVCEGEWRGEDCSINVCEENPFLGYHTDLLDRILIVESILKIGKTLNRLKEKLEYIQERVPEFEEFTSCVRFHPLIGELTREQAGTDGLAYNSDLKTSLLPILEEFNQVLEETKDGQPIKA